MKNIINFRLNFVILLLTTLPFINTCKKEKDDRPLTVVNDPIDDNDNANDDNPNDTILVDSSTSLIAKIEIITHEGHLHGKSFHANGQPTESPFLRRQEMTLVKTNTGWKKENTSSIYDVKEGKSIVMVAGRHYALECLFYNKNGKRINKSYTEAAKRTQTFFDIKSYTENKTGKIVELAEIDTSFMDYTYRDTNPDSIMYHTNNYENGLVKLLNKIEETKGYGSVGMKGYFEIKKGRISYNLNVNITEWLKQDKEQNLAFNKCQKTNEDIKITTFSLPINVVSVHPWTDAETDIYLKEMGDYFGISSQDFLNLDIWGDYDPESSQYWM